MRRYQKWLTTLGMIALTPGVAFSGPFSFTKQTAAKTPVQTVAQTTVARGQDAASGQQTAKDVGKALHKAGLSGTNIGIRVKEGAAVLEGSVGNLQQKAAATKAAASVKGIERVENRLVVTDAPAGRQGVETAFGEFPGNDPRRVQQIAFIQEGAPAAGEAPASAPMQAVPGMPPAGPPPFVPSSVPAPPGYGYGGNTPGGGGMMYNQPNFPNHAWPSYAQYPNYAAVTYPKQYSASAWPYIGPFYPYPQVPLGWRAAQLEWDDGFWNLNFRPRTDRWWWFMDYRNW